MTTYLHQPVGDGPVQTLELRKGWNKPAPPEYALPTETWREVVARRTRYEEVKARLLAIGKESGKESGTGVSPVIFHPFQPFNPLHVTRRNLPHWQQSSVAYFVTFRLGDSLPAAKLIQWAQEKEVWLKEHPQPWTNDQQAEYARLFPRPLNEWLDAGEGQCLLAQAPLAEIVENALRHFDGTRYVLDEFVVMPNHVHVLFAPMDGHQLSDVLHSWKSFTAHEINKLLNRKGTVWLDESFDHIVRSYEQLQFYRSYIGENPAKARLAPDKYRSGKGTGLRLADGTDESGTGVSPVVLEEKTTGETPVPHSFDIDINDLITLNLDLRQFAQDVIENCEGPELLRAFWHAIEKVTILDPTCGSGAFLFAALNILEPLYEACLDRMEAFVEDYDRGTGVPPVKHGQDAHATKGIPKKFSDFRKVLARVAAHPNRRYFIFKSIILNNLFGVDIMEEAVEICKVRLFLKLAAQVEPDATHGNLGIEPLPDIDFNIKGGNTLVGFATYDAAKRAITSKLDFGNAMEKIAVRAADLQQAFDAFRERQVEGDGSVPMEHKLELRKRLTGLQDELNRYLAAEYGVAPAKKDAYAKWLMSHQPFHWFVEFYGIMNGGGFDVIIENLPYVELNALDEYRPRGYACDDSGNLYALVMERCSHLGRQQGRQGYIVPVSSVSTDRYKTLQQWIMKRENHFSTLDDRPSRLFDGLEHIRLTIHLIGRRTPTPQLFSTRYNKWTADERPALFSKLRFSQSPPGMIGGTLPKLSSDCEKSIIDKLAAQQRKLSAFYSRTGPHRIFYSRKVGYFLQVLDFEPRVLDGKGRRRPPSEFKELRFASDEHARLALCCLNATLFMWFITAFSDCCHVNKREVDAFPLDLRSLAVSALKLRLMKLARALMGDLEAHSEERTMRFQHDTLTVQCIYPKASKPILDEIDHLLARHYGFTEEELDFIIHHDIKYRMGRDTEEEE